MEGHTTKRRKHSTQSDDASPVVVLRVDLWNHCPADPANSVAAALAMVGDLLLSEGASSCTNSDAWYSAQFPDAGRAVVATRHLQSAIAGFSQFSADGTVGYICTLSDGFNGPPGTGVLPEGISSGTVLIEGGLCGFIKTLPGLAFKPFNSATRPGPALQLLPSVELEDALRQIASYPSHRPSKPARRVGQEWAVSRIALAKQTLAAHKRRIATAAAAVWIGLIAVSIGVLAARHEASAKPGDPAATFGAASEPSAATTPAPPHPSSELAAPPGNAAPRTVAARPASLPPARKPKPPIETKMKAQETESAGPTQGGGVTFVRSEIPQLNAKAEKAAGDGFYDRAIQLYGAVLKLDPENSEAQHGLEKAKRNKGSH